MNRWVKKLSAVALTAGILMSNISYMPMTSSVVNAVESEVEEEVHIWDGTTDVSWYDDEETEFHISTPEQLAGLSSIVNTGKTMEGKTFILDNDIYLNDVSAYDEWKTTPPANKWTPLKEFSGTFLGENYSIVGLYGSSGTFEHVTGCMFENVTNGYVSELNLVDLYVDSSSYYSIYLGGLICSAFDSSVIKCSAQGNLKCYTTSDRDDCKAYLGGLIGSSAKCNIIGCSNMVNITDNICFDKKYTGGICGYSNSSVINCTNNGSIKALKNGYLGGICGKSNDRISNCKNNGEINSNDEGSCGGGICGNNGGIILNCYNMSEIKENGNGICGSNSDGIIRNVYNTGKIVDGYAIASGGSITNAYYLSGTALKGTNSSNDTTIAKSEANMKKRILC